MAKKSLIITMLILMMTMVVYAKSITIEAASKAQRNIIQAALGDRYPIIKMAVVKSGNHGNAYYVGAVFRAQGVEDMTGIWLVGGDKDSPNLVYSVDGVAHQFSGMRKASETKAYASIVDPEARALRKYLSK